MYSEADSYLCESVALLCCALSFAGGITQGKDDRPLIEGRHVFDNVLSKRSCDSSHSFVFKKQDRRRINKKYFNLTSSNETRWIKGFRPRGSIIVKQKIMDPFLLLIIL